MRYSKHIQQQKFRDGALLAGRFAAGGSVSITGSLSLPRINSEDELADVHAQMLLEGTQSLSKRQLQEKLDAMGASLSFGLADDRLVFVARARPVHVDELVALIAHILLEPAFPHNELAVLKKREEADLALEAQNTYTQAGGALARLMYPKEHPNYEQPTAGLLKALKKINQKSLQNFHARLNAQSLVCTAVGDIAPARACSVMQKHFSALPHAPVKKRKAATAKAAKAAKVVAHIKNKASIDYMAGIAPRITFAHKDYPALILGLQVLGNRRGFTGRLMSIVREEEGLTYGVYSYPVAFSSKLDGYAVAWGTFAPQLFAKGRASVLRELKRIVADGATEEEVRRHQVLYEAFNRVALASSVALSRAAHNTVADGRPLSDIDTFPQRMLKLTAKEVNAALKKYIKVDKLSEAAAGPIEEL